MRNNRRSWSGWMRRSLGGAEVGLVDELDLDPGGGPLATQGHADTDAVDGAGREFVLEPQDEIAAVW